MNQIAAAGRRLLSAWVLLFFVVSMTWAMTALLPSDPVQAALGPQAPAAEVQRARRLYGLDEPVSTRYVRFWQRLIHAADAEGDHRSCSDPTLGLHTDLGYSFSYRKPVAKLLSQKLAASAELAIAALLVQLGLGLSLGVLAAARRGSRADEALMGGAIAVSSSPTFVVGLALQYVLAYRLGWLPLDGYGKQGWALLESMALPAVTLGLYGAAVFARLSRNELVDALGKRYVLAARARGASHFRATFVHAARNAVTPISQLGVLELGALVGGAVVTERVFRWPGLGEMAVVALQNQDSQVIVGVTLVAAASIIVATLIADLIEVLLDPRTR